MQSIRGQWRQAPISTSSGGKTVGHWEVIREGQASGYIVRDAEMERKDFHIQTGITCEKGRLELDTSQELPLHITHGHTEGDVSEKQLPLLGLMVGELLQ